MNARTKLNAGHVYGSFVIAALVGWLTGSLIVFGLTAALLIAGSLYSGDIRISGGPEPRPTLSRISVRVLSGQGKLCWLIRFQTSALSASIEPENWAGLRARPTLRVSPHPFC